MSELKPPAAWWAVARSEEVTGLKPLSADIADQPIVLWRDKQGVARALEDRCPHRRAPLSLGCIRESGWIQCGYHGWTYDGETGRLKEIPKEQEIVAYCRGPYCLMAFEAVAELRKKGRSARRLEDGFPEWRSAGLPVEIA